MKFGGSSLAEPEKIKVMAERAVKTRADGYAVVMTVSAPADITDDLIALSKLITLEPEPREYDALLSTGENLSASLMAMAIRGRDVKAVSLSGAQAGIRTTLRHGDADIISINPARILRELRKGKIVVAAGFQGVNNVGNIATLGRGGSDLTAVALTHALRAGMCELYTDVKGIYTANPAVVPQAKKIKQISYDALMALARSGTEVRQLRAIAYAKKHRISLHLRSSFENTEGTLVGDFKSAGVKPEATCFSIQKHGDSSWIHIIGTKLNALRIKGIVRETAAADRCLLLKETYTPKKISLSTAFRDGERLLKALHKIFIQK